MFQATARRLLRWPARAALAYWLRWLPWLPCAGGVAALWALAADSRLQLDLFGLLLVGAVALLALAALRRWSPLIVVTLLLSPLAWHFAVALPGAERTIGGLYPDTRLRLDAIIRDRTSVPGADTRSVRLLLGKVTVSTGGAPFTLTELEVETPAASTWTFRSGRAIQLAGRLRAALRAQHRLRLTLTPEVHAFDDAPDWAWGEAWRIRLSDRANYYLSKRVAAVYLPLVLDVRERGAIESRDIVAAFRRVGISHIFAISGMNVALIFGMLMFLQRPLLSRLQRGQGWVPTRDVARAASVALIWLYIAMIGLPPPAVRAAIMGTALVWLESRGARTPPLYVLAVTGLAMLAYSPSQFYDISFQLSFLAYAFLVLALELGGREPGRGGEPFLLTWLRRGAWLFAMNLGVTGLVTLGLWPLIAARFGTFSWLVFAGNLLLVPVMGAVILPSAMVALVISAAYVGSAPGGWVERALFGWLEACLSAWLWLLRAVDRLGGAAYFRVPPQWSAAQGALYYAALLGLVGLLIHLRRRAWHPREPEAVPRGKFDHKINP
jgi:ComEC/Rec2-related protein